MSSPAVFSEAQSPLTGDPFSAFAEDDGNSDIQKRMMRVKVFYTFDDQNKTWCLARLPNALPIPVVAIDDSTQIGVIELRTCIQAIVTASPELISKLELDYTVYAYDYSEYETPLVGQGMLSRVLAYASPTPHAPASQSGTMITGRVCKNMLAAFSSVKETLEVKLKLVPVPTKLQNEYDKAMDSFRASNRSVTNSFGPDGDEEYSAAADMGQEFEIQPMASQQSSQRNNMANFELLHDMLTPNFGNSADQYGTEDSMSQGQGISRPGSATPSHMSAQLNTAQNFDGSRPASRASIMQSQNDSYFEDQGMEEGPARKRARLMQADWQGRSNFGGRAESLRVAASTAASIRTFRPSLDNSAIQNDLAPRAPTPRPLEKFRKPSIPQPSGLRRTSFTDMNSPAPMSEASFIDDGQCSQAGSSPDIPSSPPVYMQDDFPPPSSPLPPHLSIHTDSGFQSDLPTDFPQSDLPLPATNGPTDESEAARKLKWQATRLKRNATLEWNMYQPQTAQTIVQQQQQVSIDTTNMQKTLSAIGVPNAAKKPRKSRAKRSTTPKGSPPESANSAPEADAPPQQKETDNSNSKHASIPNDASDRLQIFPAELTNSDDQSSREQSQGPGSMAITLPKRNPLSRQGKRPTVKRLPRANTWACPSSDVDGIILSSDANTNHWAYADAATPEPQNQDVEGSKPRSGSGAVRQRSIVNALQKAVAAGETVKYCMNCGAINTPTWRPWWIRVEYGTGEDVQTGAETGIHCVEPVRKDDEGKVLTYRVYKQWSSLTPEERDSQMFEQLVLCNPCGDFFRKHKTHRPADLWDKPENVPKKSRSRSKKKKDDLPVPTSDALQEPLSTFTDPPMSDVYPTIERQDKEATKANNNGQCEMGPPHISVNNVQSQWNDHDALMALQRAIQQSPARPLGSKESPIEVDDHLSPSPVRRILFPSPRKEGEFKSLEDSPADNMNEQESPEESGNGETIKNSVMPNPFITTSNEVKSDHTQNVIVQTVEVEQPNKENCPPPIEADDSLASLFDFDASTEQSPRNARSLSHFLKTPKSKTPRREPLTNIPNDGHDQPFLFATPARQVTASSPLPNNATSGMSPFGHLNQFMFHESFSPSKFNLSPNWLKNLKTPEAVKNGGGFEFDNDFFNTLSSDMPLSSSPGLASGAAFHSFFDFYEDSTATAPVAPDMDKEEESLKKLKPKNQDEDATKPENTENENELQERNIVGRAS